MTALEMKRKAEILGILVNTADHPDYVISLARAAVEKGKTVRIHFSGPGVNLLSKTGIGSLTDVVQATVCAESLSKYGHPAAGDDLEGVRVVPATKLGRFISDCRRYVSF